MTWPLVRRLAQLGLLVGEGLALGVAFDSGPVQSLRQGWWTPILRMAGAAMPAFMALLVAVLLVRWARGGLRLSPATPSDDPPSRYLPYLGLHLVGFAAVFLLSRELFDRAPTSQDSPGPLVASWLFAIAVTLAGWIGSLWPPRATARWVREHGRLLAGAAGLGFAAFGIGRLSQGLWLPLRRATFASASFLLNTIVPSAFAAPDTLTFGTDKFAVEIAPQCSGYEGVGLAWTFLLAALWLFRDRFRFPRAFLLVAIATVLTLAANVARLTALVLVGTYLSDRLAAGGFHSYAGSILFSAVALGTVSIGLRTRWFTHASADDDDAGGAPRSNPAAPYLVPFLAVTGIGLVSRAFATAEAEPLYPLRPLAGLVALIAFRRSFTADRLRVSGWAVLAGAAVAAGWYAIERLFPHAPGAGAVAALDGRALALRAVTAIVLVPPIEELAFRGFLARRLTSAAFEQLPPSAIGLRGLLLSSAAFGLLHQRPVAAALAGVCYGLVYRRGRLADAIVAHATTNAALVLIAWLTGAWELWK